MDTGTFDQFLECRNAWIDHAATAGVKIVQVSRVATMTPPNATVRKHVGDQTKDDDNLPGLGLTVVVVPSPLLRGVVTAITWVSRASGYKTVASEADAVETARKYFNTIGVEPPNFNGEGYETPTE